MFQEKQSWFNIDNEEFELMPIDVQLLRDKLKVFCPPSQTVS